ncbi:MAG: hypothetical protein C0605_05495 [Hyphomicrobiales bacterium]|nr:MAG: hypothetical protein C0605_05495 [Hyphomicrobiales bacterium]
MTNSSGAGAAGKTVAVIDRSLEDARHYGRILCGVLPAEVHIFTSSGDALEWCLREKPDLSVIDYHMPAFEGIPFLTCFRSNPVLKRSPAILLAADRAVDVLFNPAGFEAFDILHKPVDLSRLGAVAQSMLTASTNQRRVVSLRAAGQTGWC